MLDLVAKANPAKWEISCTELLQNEEFSLISCKLRNFQFSNQLKNPQIVGFVPYNKSYKVRNFLSKLQSEEGEMIISNLKFLRL